MSEAQSETEYLITKQVASLFSVSRRTVAKWFDAGELQGFRLPGNHGDRRYTKASCIALAEKHGIPIDWSQIPARLDRKRRKAS